MNLRAEQKITHTHNTNDKRISCCECAKNKCMYEYGSNVTHFTFAICCAQMVTFSVDCLHCKQAAIIKYAHQIIGTLLTIASQHIVNEISLSYIESAKPYMCELNFIAIALIFREEKWCFPPLANDAILKY